MKTNNFARLVQLDITIFSPVRSAEELSLEINQEISMFMAVAYFLCNKFSFYLILLYIFPSIKSILFFFFCRLDLYLPRNSDGAKPVVAFVTGGAWIIG